MRFLRPLLPCVASAPWIHDKYVVPPANFLLAGSADIIFFLGSAQDYTVLLTGDILSIGDFVNSVHVDDVLRDGVLAFVQSEGEVAVVVQDEPPSLPSLEGGRKHSV